MLCVKLKWVMDYEANIYTRKEYCDESTCSWKVPVHEFDKTVIFYRDILGFEEIDASSQDNFDSVTFTFGDKNLWIDKVAGN